MAEIPPTETLTSVEHQDSTDQPNPSVSPPPPSAEGINLPEKRKREGEPEPEPSADKAKHPLWKTSLCSYFRRSGELCSHGDTCRYAHGEDELRPRPNNTWDPTSERAKKMAKTNDQDKAVEEGGIMMTEALEEDGEESSSGLSKCIVNLPMKWSSDNFRFFLNEQKLDGKTVGNNRTLKVSDVIQRPFEKNNKAALPEKPSPDNDDENDSVLPSDSASKARSARDAVTPLAHMSYSDQLEHKKNSLAQILKRLVSIIILTRYVLSYMEDLFSLFSGLPCKLEGIIESPLVNGYRNKCEFSVGNSLQGKHTVGFLLGNFREGVTAVEEPVDCPNVSRIACKYAAIFQEFLQQSCLPIWNRLNNSGFWRQLTVREGRKPGQIDADNSETSISEVMLMVQVCTLGSDEGQVKEELHRLAQTFSAGSTAESPPLPLTTLVIQDHTGISNAAPSDAPLRYIFLHRGGDCGLEIADDVVEPRIHDHISNLRFSISPSAFFQVNTLAAESLYSLAGDWADLGPDTLLFDVCCGTGTIGLTLAHRVGMVVGIEMNASAVSDAERNAEANGIKNCRFVCGKAEDVIGSLMKEYLSLPEKQDENRETSENNESGVNSAEENINSVDGVVVAENSSVVNHENGHAVSGCSKDEAKLEKDSTPQSSSNPMRQFKNVVAIVDPPRVGLHPTVIKVLRTQSRLRRLVYISCNPDSLVANAIELCTPSPDKSEKGNNKNNRGWRNMSAAGLARHRSKSMPESEPFKPVKAMAVDLFPHTPHCELVMLLER
ncbi:hypothetical protein SASPL_122817 [Salvia splendens]|uniref:C3H1-type domain-containing protein n=1 Tax=Salvia splendens TaxID=180675 RepID=A0A8X8ZSU0_SALSN|nr:hypothetical protein SASPL_122817 [Salvia splendens]